MRSCGWRVPARGARADAPQFALERTVTRSLVGVTTWSGASREGAPMKAWFITGTSRGFGREWAIAALERGDKVAATARNLASLDVLVAEYGDAILPIALDVTDRDADFAAVKRAHEQFGRLDIIANNAGYGHFGMVEE